MIHRALIVAGADAALAYRRYAGEFTEFELESLVAQIIHAVRRAEKKLAEDRITGMVPFINDRHA